MGGVWEGSSFAEAARRSFTVARPPRLIAYSAESMEDGRVEKFH